MVRSAVIVCFLIVAKTRLISGPQQTPEEVSIIPGTKLRIRLPKNWRIEPAPKELGQPYALKHMTAPQYAVVVSQSNPATQGHSCTGFIGSLLAIRSVQGTIVPRPNFVPEAYFGSVLEIPGLQVTCLSMGNTLISVMIYLKIGQPTPGVLTEILSIIADAAREQAIVVTAPGRLTLPLLNIEIPVRSDAWGYQQISDTWGKTNVLGRVSKARKNELMITPFIFPGRCETFMITPPFGHTTLVKGRNYGGDQWHADALETFPPPINALSAYACHNLERNSVLMARIEYEKPVIADSDVTIIRQMLEDIGQAIDLKYAGK
jgi:hypothetical protein